MTMVLAILLDGRFLWTGRIRDRCASGIGAGRFHIPIALTCLLGYICLEQRKSASCSLAMQAEEIAGAWY